MGPTRLLVLLSLVLLANSSQPCYAEPALKGAGSTFIQPLMDKWSREYDKAKGVKVEYQAVGSGRGLELLTTKNIDFACSDAFMTQQQLANTAGVRGEVLHIPLVMGAVVPAYNLPGVKKPLRFTGEILADIFLGKIKKWDTEALKELNPGVALPQTAITVVYRADSSGTSFIWTDFLTKTSPSWKQGATTRLAVDGGVAKEGNAGVAQYLAATPGAIGYVELRYALENNLPFGAVKNKDGQFIQADLEKVTAAASAALTSIPDDLRFSLTNAPGQNSYPICGTTWAIVYQNQPDAAVKDRLVDFLRWVSKEGQQFAPDIHYASLPKELSQRVTGQIDKISATPLPSAAIVVSDGCCTVSAPPPPSAVVVPMQCCWPSQAAAVPVCSPWVSPPSCQRRCFRCR